MCIFLFSYYLLSIVAKKHFFLFLFSLVALCYVYYYNSFVFVVATIVNISCMSFDRKKKRETEDDK